MKTLRIVTLITGFIVGTFSARGTDQIEDGFGMNLGGVFEPVSAVGKAKLADGTPMFAYFYTNGFSAFKNHYVLITPATHKIYGIYGVGTVDSREGGLVQQAFIMRILRWKYGAESKPDALDLTNDVQRIDQGNRYVVSTLAGLKDTTIDIRYGDKDLEQLAKTEQRAMEGGKVAGPADGTMAFEGKWKPATAQLSGKPMPEAVLKSISLKLDNGKYEVFVGDEPDRGTYTLDLTSEPKGMTITGTAGPNQGKTFPAIYELKGDTLRICYDLSGAKRPTEFKSVAGTQLYLVTYNRVKD